MNILKSIGNDDNMETKKLELDRDEKRNLTRKYAPFIPQMRPWLVIVEVNMSNPSNNGTECTGKIVKTYHQHNELSSL